MPLLNVANTESIILNLASWNIEDILEFIFCLGFAKATYNTFRILRDVFIVRLCQYLEDISRFTISCLDSINRES